MRQRPLHRGLRPHAHCGVGALVDLSGRATHGLVEDALRMLGNLDHRGARGAEDNTGDGAGMLIRTPDAFLRREIPPLAEVDAYAVGQLFLPRSQPHQAPFSALVERMADEDGFDVLAWRRVPTRNDRLGATALGSEPSVQQVFLRPRGPCSNSEFDRRLYVLRRRIERAAAPLTHSEAFYVCSLDRQTIVYKGLLTNDQLADYYPDLSDPDVRSSLAVVHARFSTNTLGSWPLAHPYRRIVHNGEINTLQGNLNWMRAREVELAHPDFGDDLEELKPIVDASQSDTANLDHVLELLVHSGRSLPHALRMLMPEAWRHDPAMDAARRDWYAYHATLAEPWDGPALVAGTDGQRVVAALDRNGFRPCRYAVTHDDRLALASEAGTLDLEPAEIAETGRLGPGQMLVADPTRGRLLRDEEIMAELAHERYGRWVRQNRVRLDDTWPRSEGCNGHAATSSSSASLTAPQLAFGYSLESLERLLEPMSVDGKDPVGSMGDDAPPAPLSQSPKSLFHYLKQSFAQVSNPPIDYVREAAVTSLATFLGPRGNLLTESPADARRLELDSPVLREADRERLASLNADGLRARTLETTFDPANSMEAGLDELMRSGERAIADGHTILILSDRAVGAQRAPIPSLLAASGLHHHLIRRGLRSRVGLVVDSGEPHLVHHLCALVGYGADAVCPYLAYASLGEQRDDLVEPYIHALEDGLLKVMSKMGISDLESYKGAQIFDAVGLDADLVERFFTGTISQLGGVGLADIEADVKARHHAAFAPDRDPTQWLASGGDYYWRRDGEAHAWNPSTVGALQWAARSGRPDAYRRFAELAHDHDRRHTLRGRVDVSAADAAPISLDEVESVASIARRFFSSSMSFGALSQEAHETLAMAMNRLGGVAGSGEGGEGTERFGTDRECLNKQVASGRFGVTLPYLANAHQIEIKMAQGSKPGEGGQLPGHKITEDIGRVRHTTPGVELISPPPHHDIYSIEDLAQLIHDLKCANPEAEVHVKLVARVGVGTIAAGVAKARADGILISGDSGGTGASAKTSIKHAGLPWELGLAEAQQVLLEQRLRSRVRLRVDGGLKTGRDVAVAAMLGAEAFGFGTAPLVALGCIMLRKCHCNTCSVGIATQDPQLRARFAGDPEHVVRYLSGVAQEVRETMASLGFRTVDEMVGRVDKLHPRSSADGLDMAPLLHRPESADAPKATRSQTHKLDAKRDHELIERAQPALERAEPVAIELPITNRDRTFGTLLSSRVAKRWGELGLPEDTVSVELNGTAGQSFGAFLAPGMTLRLTGQANDYVGKGLAGGKLVIHPPRDAGYQPEASVTLGNVALYGATAGELYARGQAGERFAVRNSGVFAVIEGLGQHGCEYMTGGAVVVLGPVGTNFAAGMSGGEAYLLCPDDARELESRINTARVRIEAIADPRDQQLLHRLVENHWAHTGSDVAARLLRHDRPSDRFVKVMPQAYAEVVQAERQKGHDIRPDLPTRAIQATEPEALVEGGQ
ncbi:MAG: glutamate synthase large subunit [Candidatus Bipolaricaulia bacterium]